MAQAEVLRQKRDINDLLKYINEQNLFIKKFLSSKSPIRHRSDPDKSQQGKVSMFNQFFHTRLFPHEIFTRGRT